MGWGKVSIAGHRRRRAPICAAVAPLSVLIGPLRKYPAGGLGECEGQQARAQQHETGCSQCEETVGYQVMITHVAPTTLEPHPNLLKLSESACLKEVVIAQGQALERKPSNAWARKIPALNRPKNAVTVSIIAEILRAQARTQRHATAHSQKDSGAGLKIRPE